MIVICFSILTGSEFLQIQQMRSKSPLFSYNKMPKLCILLCLLCWDSSRVPRYDHSFCDLYWFVVCKYNSSSYFLPHCECSDLSKVVADLPGVVATWFLCWLYMLRTSHWANGCFLYYIQLPSLLLLFWAAVIYCYLCGLSCSL